VVEESRSPGVQRSFSDHPRPWGRRGCGRGRRHDPDAPLDGLFGWFSPKGWFRPISPLYLRYVVERSVGAPVHRPVAVSGFVPDRS